MGKRGEPSLWILIESMQVAALIGEGVKRKLLKEFCKL